MSSFPPRAHQPRPVRSRRHAPARQAPHHCQHLHRHYRHPRRVDRERGGLWPGEARVLQSRGEPEDGPQEEQPQAEGQAGEATEGEGQGAGTTGEGAPPAEHAAGEDVTMGE
jgi:hypothetical protein